MRNKAIILIFLVVLTAISASTFSISKYESQIINTDFARAAIFSINAKDISKETDLEINCSESNTAEYIIEINNKDDSGNVSEVTTIYDIIINLKKVLPDGITMELYNFNNSDIAIEYKISDDKLTYTFSDVGKFSPGVEDTQELKLKFIVDADKVNEFEGEEIKINLHAEQVD